MQQLEPNLRLYDFEPELGSFREEVLSGLQRPRKELPAKFFYDETGSQLFDQICELQEYYPTRTELGIMEQHSGEMAAILGENCLLVEYGSGSSKKTRVLLDNLKKPAAYVPIDISKEYLVNSAKVLTRTYPEMEVLAVCADYTGYFELPVPSRPASHRVVYFPGSTIGNFDPVPAKRFLRHIAEVCRKQGGLLIGVDLKKDPTILHSAYNDKIGVTAAFNLNLLTRINRELGADFQLDQFRHYAFYNPTEDRVEMHLVSLKTQDIRLGEVEISFKAGESIWTESSYKYNLEDLIRLAATAGFQIKQVWTDKDRLFSIQYFTVG